MFEFQKLCHEVEKLSTIERGALLAEKSISVISGLNQLNIESLNPLDTLVSFIVGSVVADGTISEKDYLRIYPSLVKAFDKVDLAAIKQFYRMSKDVTKEVKNYTMRLLEIISKADEGLKEDIISLCLLITSIDGKISLREQRYIKQLCRD